MGAERPARVVLVHDWLTGTRGGEKCLEPLCRLWPGAKLFTLFHKKGSVSPEIEATRIHPSVLNKLPKVDRYYRYLLPLMPF
ncbi:MAG TPA: glycosyltransferase family 4 protein, partial [Gemmata sp.]